MKQVADLSDTEFKTLVIRMFRELIEYNKNIRGEMKVTLSEIKKNPQGTNREGKEARVQSNNLAHKEEINIQPEQKEEIRIQKTKKTQTKNPIPKLRRGLGTYGITLNIPTYKS